MYTNPNKSDYIDAKGIQLVRRDNCPLVKDVSQKVLDTIMYDLDTKLAADYARDAARQLLAGVIPIDKLVVSKSLRRISYETDQNGVIQLKHDYKSAAQPHITVALKMERRDPGTGPRSGDRVPYVFIETQDKNTLQHEKAEDPDYVKTQNIRIDAEYYLEHALNSPLNGLFELFMMNPGEELFGRIKQEHWNGQQMNLKDFFLNSNGVCKIQSQ